MRLIAHFIMLLLFFLAISIFYSSRKTDVALHFSLFVILYHYMRDLYRVKASHFFLTLHILQTRIKPQDMLRRLDLK